MQSQPIVITRRIRLRDFAADVSAERDKRMTKRRTARLTHRIRKLQRLLHANSTRAVLLIFEGMDCSGKDGAIRQVLRRVNPAGVQTTYFKAPSEDEKAHDYLWRVHRAAPRRGTIGVFNRSHYEAVLVERVMLGVRPKVCRERYRQIVAFERMLSENGVVLLKFFLHLSRREQADRLHQRLTKSSKRWKFQREDLETRRHWDEFMRAYEEMINGTSHPAARWHIIPADRKWYRNYVVADTVVRAIDRLRLKWPAPREKLDDIKIS